MRKIVPRAVVFLFAFVATIGTLTFLVAAARSQLTFQYPPKDLRYAPPRPAPPPEKNRAPRPSDISDFDDDEVPALGAGVPSYSPSQAPSYMPSYTPPPAAPDGQPAPAAPPAPRPTSRVAPETEATAPTAPPHRAKPARTPKPGGYRRVAGKTFKQGEDGVFVDTTYRAEAGLRVVEVKAGSPEYTRLLDERRELTQFFRLADRLVVVLDDVVYRVVP